MSTNSSHIRTLRARRQAWAHFDALSREIKELAWNCPFKPAMPQGPFALVHSGYLRALERFAKDTELRYGKDHPQSWSRLYSRSSASSDELGF